MKLKDGIFPGLDSLIVTPWMRGVRLESTQLKGERTVQRYSWRSDKRAIIVLKPAEARRLRDRLTKLLKASGR